MADKERFITTLFSEKEREILDVKLCRGDAAALTADDICRELIKSIDQVSSGKSQAVEFLDRGKLVKRKLAEVLA